MITRENYEEYFLLYTDNELPVAERQEVERFVADHPDLREEWETLLQCRLFPEADLVFPGRGTLLKSEIESSWTEDLLCYLDNELDEAGKSKVESLLRRQPEAAKEFASLRRTVAHADPAIVYPEKAGLYKEETSRRIVMLPWLRSGIAAAVAGAVALLFLLPAKPSSPSAPAVASGMSASAASNSASPLASASPSATSPSAASASASVPGPVSDGHHRNFAPVVTSATAASLHNRTGQQRMKKEAYADLASGLTERAGRNPVEAVINTDPGKTAVQPDPAHAVAITSLPQDPSAGDLAAIVHPAVERGIPKVESSFATQALQEEATDGRDNDFASEDLAPAGKTKLRGIFRKVTRAFVKTADRDSDGNRQVMVGAFAVSLN